MLGLHFVAEGIRRGERCLYLSFQQSSERLIERGETFGWPFRAAAESGLLQLRHLAAHGTSRFPDYLSALTGLLASVGATTLMTSETTAFFGPAFELPQGLGFVADNVILLRYAEIDSEVRRALVIVKMRDGDHIKNIIEVDISTGGLIVKGKFEGLTGVLGGTPEMTRGSTDTARPHPQALLAEQEHMQR